MGMDKGMIEYHGKPQREYLYNLLGTFCARTFLSIRAHQESQFGEGFNLITDTDRFRGPFNGILSAHACHPDKAWIVLACDLPLIDTQTIKALIDSRDTARDATALATVESGLPEPLAAIWEAGGLEKAWKHLENSDSSCPRKFLIHNANTCLVNPLSDQVLSNANTLTEYQEIWAKLGNS
jgi:molybdenum cofactor guanylyltransferase